MSRSVVSWKMTTLVAALLREQAQAELGDQYPVLTLRSAGVALVKDAASPPGLSVGRSRSGDVVARI